jgi:hypothetical protein
MAHHLIHIHATRGDGTREADGDNSDDAWQALAHDPTPSEAATLAETP